MLGDQRESGLLPRDPRGAVREGGRPGYDLRGGHQPAVPLGVDPLAHHREVGVLLRECREQTVDVSPEATPVSGNSTGVDENPWRHDAVHLERSRRIGCVGPSWSLAVVSV